MDANDTYWLYRPAGSDFAADEGWRPAWLQKAKSFKRWQASEQSWGSALEAALFDLAGEPLRDGLFPWAAWGAEQAGLSGQHWAELHLVHWHVSNGQVISMPPQWPEATQLDRLWDELAEFVAVDGWTLVRQGPERGWIEGPWLQDLPCASLDKVMGRPVAHFLPDSGELRRLQSELQMWFYQHPALQTSARTVNSVWFSGTGRLTPALKGVLQRLRPLNDCEPPSQQWVLCANDTRASLWRTDSASWWQRWQRRWQPIGLEGKGQ